MYQWSRSKESLAEGRSGTVYTCSSPAYDKESTDDDDKDYILKLFKKGKANSTFIKEVDLHRAAAEIGVAPRIIDFYVGGTDRAKGAQSYIVMEKLDQTIFNIIRSQGKLSDEQWNEIINLYKKLDKIPVLHNDSNPSNVMVKFGKKPRFYLLDYGMSKRGRGNMTISFPLLRTQLLREEQRCSTTRSPR